MTDDQLANDLAALVRRVPGVLQAYDARPIVAAVVADAAAVLRSALSASLPTVTPPSPASGSPIVVARTAEGLAVTVKIAVGDDRPAAETCREVYEVLAEALAARPEGDEGATVSVQVSRIG